VANRVGPQEGRVKDHNGFKIRLSPSEGNQWHIEVWTPGRDTSRPAVLEQLLDFASEDEAERWTYSWIDRHGNTARP
jgi:hypothetical protein